ncbi:MAG: hypothetical protein ACFFFB_05635, partial [Candidatus Heimdallarchaeota archaeon]
SLIKQSLFTNDTNIFSQFDTHDPAFYKCNVLISASNTKNPGIFPIAMTENSILEQYSIGFNRFIGFLYYDNEVDPIDAEIRAERALEIIRRKFQIDLIMVNSSEPNFFPFVGDYPNWDVFFEEITTNLPMDGYWSALDIPRLISEDYLSKYHLSSTFMILNSLDFFEGDFEIDTDQLNFNVNSLDLSFLENLETEELIEQINNIIENYGDIFNATLSEDELEQLIDSLGTFTLSNDSHYTTLLVQYEGLPEGIVRLGEDQYQFDLWNAMGYSSSWLAPSEKIYIALVGAFMTDIEIEILCSEITDTTPMNFEFDDYLLEQIGLILYLAGIEFNIQSLKDYSFEIFWVNEEGFKRSYVKPVNLNDPVDIINLIQQLGFQGLSYIPTGIVNPIDNIMVTYNLSHTEPNLLLKKELVVENASFGAFRNFSYYISAENVGNTTAWGYPTPIPITLNDMFLIMTLGSQVLADEFQNTIWEVVRIEYPNQYDSLEDFFNFNEDPRIFSFDSLGSGIYDTFFPDILNFTNLSPYNSEMDNVIDIIMVGYPQLITALNTLGLTPTELKNIFTNKNSVWNDENWKLDPGEIISYTVENVSISDLDSFRPYYTGNFTIDSNIDTPEIILGTPIIGTTPYMALLTDTENWIIESVDSYLSERVEINFVFQNNTSLDLNDNNLERVSIIINFSTPTDLEAINFEIFNFENEEFQDITPNLELVENNRWTFSFINNNNSLDWLFYPLEQKNHTMLFKLSGVDSEKFNISINNLDVEFSTRDININDDTGSKVIYGSSTGNIQFDRKSNSIPLGTYDMASIIVSSFLNNSNSSIGDPCTYILHLKNIGSRTANNISISLPIPGIMNNPGVFTLENDNLTYNIAKIAPFEEKIINFSFYIPNTRSISEVIINYKNPENVQGGNSSNIISLTNEVYVSAQIDYLTKIPFVRLINISSNVNDSFLSHSVFNFTYDMNLVYPHGLKVPDITIIMHDQIGNLRRIDSNTIYFEDIEYNETISFNMTLKKMGWKSYYYIPINFIESSESSTIQILHSDSRILGEINFTIEKKVDREHIDIGDEIMVFIDVENTGTINVSNIMINDVISYSQSYFSLIRGKLVYVIPNLEPGEKVSINYTIKAKRQGIIRLNPAHINYYYLHRLEASSNDLSIKINTPQKNQILYVLIPGVVVIFVLIIYFQQYKKYKKKKNELHRIEMHIFDKSSRDSILNIEHTLRERLKFLSKDSTEKRN